MKKAFFLLLISLAVFSRLKASHIVGGEIEIVNKRGYTFTISVKMYVDPLHAVAGVIAQEKTASIGIFEKGTNIRRKQMTLPLKLSNPISYAKVCDAQLMQQVSTTVLYFSGDIVLDPSYSNPSGYYIIYENCCRNEIIANIEDPADEGMAFYTEFPPVRVNNQNFTNSSPRFLQIVGDFPCLNRPFTFDFSGIDNDKDSLVYELSTPLAGHLSATDQNQFPNPAPYPEIVWQPGYGITNQIPGHPALSINSHTGQITLTASQLGTYVFSVNVYEYRKGVKIGMVKRDFQFPVVQCSDNAPPAISMELPGGKIYDKNTDVIELTVDSSACYNVLTSDSSTYKFHTSENLNISIIKNTLPSGVLSIGSSATVTPQRDTASNTLCINACDKLYINNDTVYTFSLVVNDGPKCPVSLTMYDTLDVAIKFKMPTNHKPSVNVVQPGPYKVTRGKFIYIDVYATDKDSKDNITLTGSGLGFNLGSHNMSFPTVTGKDSISSRFKWYPDCKDLNPGNYKVRFFVKDNSCLRRNTDTLDVVVSVEDTTTILNEINPVTLITPNGDNKNEVFEIPDIPDGNCEYYFKKVTVYNRWGSRIFESTDPRFKWDASDEPCGVYFYMVDLNKKVIKKWIEIIR